MIETSVEPTDSGIVLPKVVDEVATQFPDQTWMTIPEGTDSRTWRDVTFKELAQAVNGLAWWIEESIGKAQQRDVVAYMGINDVRYAVALIGLMKAGYKPMLPSLRNSLEGQLSLMKATNCGWLLHTESIDVHLDPLKTAATDLRTLKIPSFDECLLKGSQKGSYPNCYSTSEDDQVLVLHTSGSTGLPKPIYLTNGAIGVMGELRSQEVQSGRQTIYQVWSDPEPLFSMLPFFHMLGFCGIVRSIVYKAPLALLPTDKPISADLILDVLRETNPWGAVLAPSMMEELSGIPEGLEALSKLQCVFFGGAPLAAESGQRINKHTTIYSILGTTECGPIVNMVPVNKKDWQYFEWAPRSGVVMELDGENLYEMVLKYAGDRKYQAVFFNFPDLKKWRTKDLYEQHPTNPNLWRYVGRKDDVLVLSNGEKFNGLGFELKMEDDAFIQGALVVGQGRFQTGLLIEPSWDKLSPSEDVNELIDRFWPVVEKANSGAPSHGRVWKSKIAITKPEKPMKRAPKGSIMRQATIKLYQDEIEALYSNEGFSEELGKLDNNADLPAVGAFMRKAFGLALPDFPQDADETVDIFRYGVNSLQILGLSSALNHAIGDSKDATIAPKDIYGNNTIKDLTDLLFSRLHQETEVVHGPSREEAIATMINEYTEDLASPASDYQFALPNKHTVVLTGSTGSLGNNLLQELIESPKVAKVYCLNRSADAQARQTQTFEERGSSTDFSKVTFLKADFGKDQFGLSDAVYRELLDTVDTLIHNAWAVDFNMSLKSYEPVHVSGVRRCVDFSIHSTNRAHIVFISSIAAVGNWAASHPEEPEVPESLVEENSVPLPQGYGESKNVAERILGLAAARAQVPATILRAGQLAGSTTVGGLWNKQEWLPSIVATSKAMGVVPKTLGNNDIVDWVPMNLAAKTAWELVEARAVDISKKGASASVYHLVNPSTSNWGDLVPALQAAFGQPMLVSFDRWLDDLKTIPLTADEAERKPSIKLIGFYEGLRKSQKAMPRMATRATAEKSKTLRNMKAVDADLMRNWLQQWQF